jgi:hypothetical protein
VSSHVAMNFSMPPWRGPVTGTQDRAAENALWTGVSSRTGLVAIAVSSLDV